MISAVWHNKFSERTLIYLNVDVPFPADADSAVQHNSQMAAKQPRHRPQLVWCFTLSTLTLASIGTRIDDLEFLSAGLRPWCTWVKPLTVC